MISTVRIPSQLAFATWVKHVVQLRRPRGKIHPTSLRRFSKLR